MGTTTPNPAAVLELRSTHQGVLLPRVSLTASNSLLPITGTASTSTNGLWVYNTNTATTTGLSGTGYYVWEGGASGEWIKLTTAMDNAPFLGTDDHAMATENTEEIYSLGNLGVGTATLEASAALQVESTTQGFLPPRMTAAERDAMTSTAATGTLIVCTDCGALQVFNGSAWNNVTAPSSTATGVIQQLSGECSALVNGHFVAGQAIDNTGKYVQIQLNIETAGSYVLTTTTVNNYSFSVEGETKTTAGQMVTLSGTGTPTTAQTDTFRVYFGTSSCTFDITIHNP